MINIMPLYPITQYLASVNNNIILTITNIGLNQFAPPYAKHKFTTDPVIIRAKYQKGRPKKINGHKFSQHLHLPI